MDMTELASSVMVNFMSMLSPCCSFFHLQPECPKGGNVTVHHRDKVAFPVTQSTPNVPWTQKRRLHRVRNVNMLFLIYFQSSLLAIPSTNAAYSITAQITTSFTES
jgi:hypothetical protein